MDSDSNVERWLRDLGLNVSRPPQAKEHFHVLVTPPQGGPAFEVIRPTENQKFYLVVMGIAIYQGHQDALKAMREDERKKFLNDLKYDLLKMGTDVILMPMGDQIPQVIQIVRVLLIEDITPNDLVNCIYLVKNAGMLVISKFSDTFGTPQTKGNAIKYI
ncbi:MULTISPECIES: DUF2299 domain-containing protein [Acidianus]|uniref:DUF2299 domain-containing protein n=1 Tax=Candidatus Acidianus copahuensis TaxID=1160895 RepID=A0A031LMW2_9CREN|nr:MULTISPECIES: DUF2299 domain-containing protein [Acidianus]EZQ04816.1 hypothetical protein CM19_07475 [Candidatus Acidianus copahuensis]NON62256.1 DUF2299 domain-containing protein [Acidianus sp. RZ1]